jgi:hypothetical protein
MGEAEDEATSVAEHSVDYVVADPSGQFAAAVTKDAVLQVWSLADGEAVARWRVPDGPPQAVAISPNVRTVALKPAGAPAIWRYDVATGLSATGCRSRMAMGA